MPRNLIIGEPRHLIEINAIGHRIDTILRAGNIFCITVGAFLELACTNKHVLPDTQRIATTAGFHHRATHFNARYQR